MAKEHHMPKKVKGLSKITIGSVGYYGLHLFLRRKKRKREQTAFTLVELKVADDSFVLLRTSSQTRKQIYDIALLFTSSMILAFGSPYYISVVFYDISN